MATLLFLLLHWAGKLNSAYDCYWLCLLIALELPQYIRIAIHLRGR